MFIKLNLIFRETATKIRENRHAVDCIPIGVSRYYVYDDPNRPKTPPPPT